MQWTKKPNPEDLRDAFDYLKQTERKRFEALVTEVFIYCVAKKSHLEEWGFRAKNRLDDAAKAMGLDIRIEGRGAEPKVVIAMIQTDPEDGLRCSFNFPLEATPA
jgi:hypothetical protein